MQETIRRFRDRASKEDLELFESLKKQAPKSFYNWDCRYILGQKLGEGRQAEIFDMEALQCCLGSKLIGGFMATKIFKQGPNSPPCESCSRTCKDCSGTWKPLLHTLLTLWSMSFMQFLKFLPFVPSGVRVWWRMGGFHLRCVIIGVICGSWSTSECNAIATNARHSRTRWGCEVCTSSASSTKTSRRPMCSLIRPRHALNQPLKISWNDHKSNHLETKKIQPLKISCNEDKSNQQETNKRKPEWMASLSVCYQIMNVPVKFWGHGFREHLRFCLLSTTTQRSCERQASLHARSWCL